MKSRICAVAIIHDKNRLLFGKKKENIGPYPNSWMLIGGGINLDSETVEEALLREIKEETQLTVANITQIGFDEDFESDKNGKPTHYIFLIYSVQYVSGTPIPGDDIIELKWFNKNKIKNLSLSRPTIKLFKKLKWL